MEARDTFDNNKLKTVGYCRSGSERGVDEQIQTIEKYIENSYNMELLKICADIRCTGRDAMRSEYIQMMEMVQNQKVDVIICTDIFRISRTLTEVIKFINIMQQLNVRYVFLNNPEFTRFE